MKPAPFEYERPDTVDAAIAALAKYGAAAKVLAGGQSLIPMLNFRLAHPERLIDIGRIADLKRIVVAGNEVRVGAAVTHNTLLASADIARACPLVVEAYGHVAHHGVRNRGTIGGSLCNCDPAAEMPVVMSVLGATMVARSAAGERLIQADSFFTGMFQTALRPDELLVEIRIPARAAGQGWGFREVSQRKGDYALVAAAAVLRVEGGVCRDVRIGYANAGLAGRRSAAAEAALEGKAPSPAAFAAAGAAAATAADPLSDHHADAEYRRDLIRSLTGHALADALSRAR